MKAAVCEEYGSPDVVRIVEVEKPVPKENQVLVKVVAASVNPLDCGTLKGRPFAVRLMTGLRRPKYTRPGVDFAGEVEAVGARVRHFAAGDEVFGVCLDDPQASGLAAWVHTQGAFAEYVSVRESTLARKPEHLSFEEAAAVPVAALTALQGLRDVGHLQPDQSVLVNGAAGGVGTFAVQIAKAFGARVTGVCSASNLAMVRAIGADRVIDYAQTDFTRKGERYDVIFDCIGNHSLKGYRRALKPRGICVMAGQLAGTGLLGVLRKMCGAALLSKVVSESFVTFLARPAQRDLALIGELLEAGSIRPVVDKSYGLEEMAAAIRYLEDKHARGKVTIRLAAATVEVAAAAAAPDSAK